MFAWARALLQLQRYTMASGTLRDWVASAESLALLDGAASAGILGALDRPRTPVAVAAITHIDAETVSEICLSLEVHGIVRRAREGYQLAPDFAVLMSPKAVQPLSNVLREAGIVTRHLRSLGTTGAGCNEAPAADVLALAQTVGPSALADTRQMVGAMFGYLMPEASAVWKTGGRHLDVGCGVGNNLFEIVAAYPKLTAVGIEIEQLTAAEARGRAKLLGFADRVDVWQINGAELQEEGGFDTAEWGQHYFPEPGRPAVLRAIWRALKPGGYLFTPVVRPLRGEAGRRAERLGLALRALGAGQLATFFAFVADVLVDTPGGRRKAQRLAARQRLLHSRFGVRARSASELQAELESGGFRVLRVVPLPTGESVQSTQWLEGFLLAQREAA